MAIEGPLRELGIHDVFQLLDLSRKTGTLRVTSQLRDNDGTVFFDNGRVIHASMRSQPQPLGTVLVRAGKISESDLEHARNVQRERMNGPKLGELLIELGAITPRELERQVRQQIEAVVFELMSWREGFFSFEERGVADAPLEASIRISTESLLMEGARRIDEWSRIADKVPNLGVVPVLAPVDDNHPTLLDLLPNEWSVLALIDGSKDLRMIAAALGQSDFDVAKVMYGLVSTGVVALKNPEKPSSPTRVEDPTPYLQRGANALALGRVDEALSEARAALAADPGSAVARLLAARALVRLQRLADSMDELRRAAEADPLNPDVHLEMAYAAARRGDMAAAVQSWDQFLKLRPSSSGADRVRAAMESAMRLHNLIEAHYSV
jgi:Tfp pilus assembly protein PilF